MLSTPESSGEVGVLPLSDVKRLFRRHFSLELNETALGYTRVFDLLQDPRLRDVCTLESQGNGQVMVHRVNATLFWPAPVVPRFAGQCEAGERVPPALHAVLVPSQTACLLSTMPVPCTNLSPLSAASAPSPVSAASVMPCGAGIRGWDLVSPGANPRGKREESDATSTDADSCADSCADSSADWVVPSSCDDDEAVEFSEGRAALPVLFSPCRHIVKNTFIDVTPEEASMTGTARHRARSEPRNMLIRGSTCRGEKDARPPQLRWADMSDDDLLEEDFFLAFHRQCC